MNESNFTKISLVGTVAGLFLLYIFFTQVHPIHVNIGDIDSGYLGENVNITGKIVSVRESGGNIFFDLDDGTGKIKVVLWGDTIKLLELHGINASSLKNGKEVNVVGNVQIYRGDLEVIPVRGNVKIL